jgi:hypothetical protein
MGKKDAEAEDLAIQDTLAMDISERLKLLAALIVDKIDEDQQNGQPILKAIAEMRNV